MTCKGKGNTIGRIVLLIDFLATRHLPVTVHQAAQFMGCSEGVARSYLETFEASDWTHRSGGGIRNDPYKWTAGPGIRDRFT